jgi:hypothetical protein
MVLRRRDNALDPLPALPLDSWLATKNTLQLYTQVVGKLRLALSPPEPEWAHVTFYVTARGLTTGPMPYRGRTFQIQFDLVAHELVIDVSDGGRETLALEPRSVADFYNDIFALLEELDILVDVNPIPQEVPNPISFEKDTAHASYDAKHVGQYWRILSFADTVLKQHRAPFRGRHTPVHFFWGGFDLAYTRYCGRPAPPPPGAGKMMREAMDEEEIYAGFWPGDARFSEPAFGAYIYPKPAGLEAAKIGPDGAAWNDKIGLFLLPYEVVRTSSAPSEMVLEFLSTTYSACGTCARWDRQLME